MWSVDDLPTTYRLARSSFVSAGHAQNWAEGAKIAQIGLLTAEAHHKMFMKMTGTFTVFFDFITAIIA